MASDLMALRSSPLKTAETFRLCGEYSIEPVPRGGTACEILTVRHTPANLPSIVLIIHASDCTVRMNRTILGTVGSTTSRYRSPNPIWYNHRETKHTDERVPTEAWSDAVPGSPQTTDSTIRDHHFWRESGPGPWRRACRGLGPRPGSSLAVEVRARMRTEA